jgi:pyrimidine deaminase RibD-like protein
MDQIRIRELMIEAIDEARKSRFEDDRNDHPLVGAILTDEAGKIILRSHRGEASDDVGLPKGVHAEYVLLEKAKRLQIDLSKTVLFTTLEPCTKRSKHKVPCAIRVVEAGIPLVYVGDIDPNLDIMGLGEAYVSDHTTVERFPSEFVKQLRHLNEKFWDKHRHKIHWTVSMYAASSAADEESINSRPVFLREREPLLHQSLDLICRSEGPIWISAGDCSWISELYIGLLRASLEKRAVRVLSAPRPGKELNKDVISALVHLGADFVALGRHWPVRATISTPLTDRASMLFLEDKHAGLYETPSDRRLINAISGAYEDLWVSGVRTPGARPSVNELSTDQVLDALKKGVPRYERLKIEPYEVAVESLLLLPKKVQRFKLFRLNQLQVMRIKYGLPTSFVIDGFPTPTTPPVFERLPDGRTVVIDGAHRAYAAHTRGESTLSGLLVHNPQFDLPSTPMPSWDDIKLTNTRLERKDRYKNPSGDLFRPIRKAFRVLARDPNHC